MSVEIAWKQNILVTDFHLLKSLLVVLGFGSQAFVCGFSRQNINSASLLRCHSWIKLGEIVSVEAFILFMHLRFQEILMKNSFCNSKKVGDIFVETQVLEYKNAKGPSIKDVSPNLRFLGYPPSPCLPKSTSERLLFGHFLYPPPSPFGETSFMDGP